jgi:hypothetical protein
MSPAPLSPPPPQQSGEQRHAHPEPSVYPGSRWQRVQGPLALAGLGLLAALALHVRDPHQQGSWGFCPWLLLTGTYCPGCGGLRAVNDLTNGDVIAAASSNLLVVALVPVVAVIWVRSLRQRWQGVRRPWPASRVNVAWTVAVVTVVVFSVVRNLPLDVVSWLAP